MWPSISLDMAFVMAAWGVCFFVMGIVMLFTVLALVVRGRKACCSRVPTIAFFHPYR